MVVKVAVTVDVPVRDTVHVLPDGDGQLVQLVNVDPLFAAAVRVMDVALAKLPEQLAPQLIPAGELVTVPVPVPESATVSV